MTVSIGMVAL